MNNVLPDATVNDTKEGPCAICLEETITKILWFYRVGMHSAFHVSGSTSNHLHLRKARLVRIAGGRFQMLWINL